LQDVEIPASAWDGKEGCNELLNITAPDIITALHRSFVEAGAMVLETNTFGATSVVLAEYDLQDQVQQINQAAVDNARRAIDGKANCYVAGSVGPTTKLVSMGHITREALTQAYRQQITTLVEAGVDLLIIETCQDLLQVKTAMITAFEVLEQSGREIPVCVSVTIEQTGTMLVGSDIAAVAATLEPFPVFSLGMNCATGPEQMASHLRYLSQHWPGRISCLPNQGLPEVVNGRTVYPLKPSQYVEILSKYVREFGVSIVGGCCGTTPEHIAALSAAIKDCKPGRREVSV
jgi:5-methyltetrahydrofolate--homocysteine methyltransferase